MTDLSHQNDIQAKIAGWLQAEQEGEEFPVPFDEAWLIAGYSRKDNAKKELPKAMQGGLYLSFKEKTGGRPREIIQLSCDGLKHLCLAAKTEQGYQVRQYFIEAEKRWKATQEVASEVSKQQQEIDRDQLEIQVNGGASVPEIVEAARGYREFCGEVYAQGYFQQQMRKHQRLLAGDPVPPKLAPSYETVDALVIPRDLAKELKLYNGAGNPDSRKVNVLLVQLGLQKKIGDKWAPIGRGVDFCVRKPVDTSSRTQQDQLFWKAGRVLPLLEEHILRLND